MTVPWAESNVHGSEAFGPNRVTAVPGFGCSFLSKIYAPGHSVRMAYAWRLFFDRV
jgi:hypothetical protein